MSEAGWHPVGLSGDLTASTSMGTRLHGREVVVWRGASGGVQAWEDRCPHRGMRLSFGFVRGNQLACLYHGWRYDEAGRCRAIPAHPQLEVPATIRANAYAAREAHGLIWVALSDEGSAIEAPAARDLTPLRSLFIDRSAETLSAALQFTGAGHPISGPWWRFEAAPTIIHAALQPIAADRTALHLQLASPESDKVAAAFWAEELRRSIEAMPPSAEAA